MEADASLDPPLDSHPTANATQRDETKSVLENKEAANISDNGGLSLPGSQVADSQNLTQHDAPCDPEKIRKERAATKAQAAFRGYLVIFCFSRHLMGLIPCHMHGCDTVVKY